MLVVISDLHLTDGTTSRKKDGKDLSNVSERAFRLFFEKISSIVTRRESIKDVTIVYNGDIFDPLRSERWFSAAKKAAPWKAPYSPDDEKDMFHSIMEDIVREHKESLKWLSCTHDDFRDVWKSAIRPSLVYIPGNHDRTVNMHEPTRMLVHDKLLNKKVKKRFRNFLTDERHQCLVMHGHEADAFNCEFKDKNPLYDKQPIGDAMTTMLFTSIGHSAQALNITREVKDRFRDIEHVRPNFKGIRYVQDIIKDFPDAASKITRMIDAIVDEFKSLDYYEDWNKAHDRFNIGFDEADKLQVALRAISLLGPNVPTGILEKVSRMYSDSPYPGFAEKMLRSPLLQGMRYCVFGHTHEAEHVPLYVDGGVERHYLNTGTFRVNLAETIDGAEFLRFQRMCFVVIYAAGELDPEIEYPMFELWSGLRMA